MRLRGIGLLVCCLGASALRAEEHWICVRSPHFNVLTAASESQARSWATTMEQFYRGMNATFGGVPDSLPLVTVVLFKRDADFRAYTPLENGVPAKMGGFFARTDDMNVIAVALDSATDDVRHRIQHETLHWYFSGRRPRLPLWLEEGLAEVFSTFRLPDPAHAEIGDPLPRHVQLLKKDGLAPIEQLVAVTRGSIQYNETQRTGMFYAESWLLAHYLIFGSGERMGVNLGRFIQLLQGDRTPEAAFQQVFGGGFETVRERLAQYLDQGFRKVALFPVDENEAARSLQASPARAGDVEIAFGSLLLATRTPGEAEICLRRAEMLLSGEPRPWECLGDLELRNNDLPMASADFGRALAAGSKNYRVYYNLALTRLGDRPDMLDQVPLASSPDSARSLELVRQSIALNPHFLPSVQLFAWLICTAPAADANDVAILAQAVAGEPGLPILAVGLGAAEIKTGRRAQGRARLEAIVGGAAPGAPPSGAALARAILQSDDRSELNRRFAALVAEGRFHDAAIAIAAFEASDPQAASADYPRLEASKQQALDFQRIADARAEAKSGQVGDAVRELLRLLTDPHLSPQGKREAQRLLGLIQKVPAH